jgi:uncharacterized C2H2 Zn-finger protein
MLGPQYGEMLPACPNCKASVSDPDRVYKVVVEPEQGERGIVKRDIGMFRCPRCDTTFPRVLGRVHYLLVPETEFNRMKKEGEESKARAGELEGAMVSLKKEKLEHEETLTRQLRDKVISSLESELGQLERHVKHLQAERDRLKNEIAAP